MPEPTEEPRVEEQAAPPKKKSKLPLIMALVLVLGGGGFFAMKMKGGAKQPEVKLSKEKAVDLKEFLVNLRDKGVYCRTEISLGLADGADPKSIEDHEAAVRDAINLRITSKSLDQVDNVAGLKELKREIASDVNKVLDDKKPEPTGESRSEKKPGAPRDAKPAPPAHPDWDSETGPVLKIYFSSFATQ